MFKLLIRLISGLLVLAIVGLGGVVFVFWHYGQDLPDYHQLANYEPPVTTRVYAGDGRLVTEYAVEKRSYVPFSAIPQRLIHAVLSAEDKDFYQHSGVDPMGILRSALVDLKRIGTGSTRRPTGASTITQQVARRFFLTNELSVSRKVKEAILAFRIERTFTKQHILELYLNENYLGQSSYGVAAAALNYFDKSLDELDVAECAFLAALLKAPGHNPQAFRERRDYVIGRMREDGYITAAEAKAAMAEPIVTRPRAETVLVRGGDYFAEDIRREIADQFGEEALYKGGLAVRSTLDPGLQDIATRALRAGLVAYDRRHGWRGPLATIDAGTGWAKRLAPYTQRADLAPWLPAVVLATTETHAEIGLPDGHKGLIPLAEFRWTRARKPADAVSVGDVVPVSPVIASEDGKEKYGPETYALQQMPKIEGAIVAMDPHTGRVLAMQGGFSYARSQFNRATQALRQPGSSFKPFVYMAAMEEGATPIYTPSSLVMDAPVEFEQGPGLPKWRPQNYHGEGGQGGPTTLRVAIEESLNLVTIRLAASIGMPRVASMAERFGVVDKLPHELAMAIGAADTTPMRMATAYAQIVNGGRKISPTLIDRIQDKTGKTIYRHDTRTCEACDATFYTDQEMPDLPDERPQLVDPMTAYQMVHILEGVVDQPVGTAYHSGISAIGKPLAGKTGTTNDSKDTWFVGFSPDLVAAVFVGFDEPASLGYRESGATVAAPIFRDFMAEALKDKPATPFRVPPGIRLVRVNATTGRPAQPGETNVIYEAFKPDTVPDGTLQEVLNNGRIPDAVSDAAPPVDDAPIAVREGPADNGGPLRATLSPPPVMPSNVTPPNTMATVPATATPAAALPSARPANPDPQAGGLY